MSFSTSAKIPGLDTLRAIAILLVFFFHYAGIFEHPVWMETAFKFGWTGVDLFFVLSGYLIASQLFASIQKKGDIGWRNYFIKRAFRILPMFLVVLGLYFLFPSLRERDGLAPFWKYIFFVQNIGLDLRTQGNFSHAWSLCVEEWFYLLFPFLLYLLLRSRQLKKAWVIWAFVFIAVIVIRWKSFETVHQRWGDADDYLLYWYQWIYYPTWCRLDGLLVGIGIAAIWQFRSSWRAGFERRGNYFLLLALVPFGIAGFLFADPYSFNASIAGFTMVALGYGCLLVAAISPATWLYRFGPGFFRLLAQLSYVIYLTHKMVIHTTQVQFSKLGVRPDSLLMLLICMITCMGIAWGLHYLIERPFLLIRNRLLRKLAPSRLATSK